MRLLLSVLTNGSNCSWWLFLVDLKFCHVLSKLSMRSCQKSVVDNKKWSVHFHFSKSDRFIFTFQIESTSKRFSTTTTCVVRTGSFNVNSCQSLSGIIRLSSDTVKLMWGTPPDNFLRSRDIHLILSDICLTNLKTPLENLTSSDKYLTSNHIVEISFYISFVSPL